MKFILIPIISIAVCQIIKFAAYFWRGGVLSKQSILWEGFWSGRSLSRHGALLGSSLYLLWVTRGLDAVFGFAFVASMIFVYSLLEDKKRHEILESYITESKDEMLKKIVTDRKLRDFNGHTLLEIILGVIIGLSVSIMIF